MNFKKKQKGFSFAEIIIAVFIFALMMVAVTGIFSSSIGGYRTARIVQKNLEDAQFIMNQMAKILRTSSVVSSSSDNIIIYDYSSDSCYNYKFEENKIKVSSYPESISGKEIEDFCTNNFTIFSALTDSFVQGKFFAIKSDKISGNEKLGKVTVSMRICLNSSCTTGRVNIQTSVSLRDYYNAGI